MAYTVMGSSIWDTEHYAYHISKEKCCSDIPLHIQEYNEIFVILSGEATHVLLNASRPLKRGDCFVWKNDMAHGFLDVHEMEFIKLSYLPNKLKQQWDTNAMPGFSAFFLEPTDHDPTDFSFHLELSDSDLSFICAMENMLSTEMLEHDSASDGMIDQSMQALMAYLACRYIKNRDFTRKMQLFLDAKAYIMEHLSDKIKVPQVAKAVHISSRQLDRAFQACCGMSPLSYIIQLRMEAATDLLMNTELSIPEIAEKMGFEQTRYFTQQYKTFYGIRPSQVKRRMKYKS